MHRSSCRVITSCFSSTPISFLHPEALVLPLSVTLRKILIKKKSIPALSTLKESEDPEKISKPILFSQKRLNDFIRDLAFYKRNQDKFET